jgi:hypothetical protein
MCTRHYVTNLLVEATTSQALSAGLLVHELDKVILAATSVVLRSKAKHPQNELMGKHQKMIPPPQRISYARPRPPCCCGGTT